jgi:hypothetical protein
VHQNLDGFRDFIQRAFLTPAPSRVSNGPVLASVLREPVAGQPVVAVAFLGKRGLHHTHANAARSAGGALKEVLCSEAAPSEVGD